MGRGTHAIFVDGGGKSNQSSCRLEVGRQDTVYYKIPVSYDQRIFYVDQPSDPGSCCFGNSTHNIGSFEDGQRNSRHVYNLNEHILDHTPEGKSCLTIEIKLK